MPLPNEHACSLRTDVTVVGSRTRTTGNGKKYRILFGIPKRGNGSVERSYRYPKANWSASEARAHCSQHGGKFEAALVQSAARRLSKAARGR